jgi:DNA-binding response OmpR family regulator
MNNNFEQTPDAPRSLRDVGIHEIVIVDATCDRYADFVEAAQAGDVGLHFCVDGRSAIRLSRRFRADAWLVGTDLPDMSGFDLLSMLSPSILQGEVDPLMEGSRVSLDRVGEGMRPGVFLVSDAYSLDEEQRSLACGVAGYLVRPVTVDVILATRAPHVVSNEVAG